MIAQVAIAIRVNSGATLAAHMRESAAHAVGTSTDWPQRALLITADLLDACPHSDATCLRSVVADLDARAEAAPEHAVSGERRSWDALAHAVERVAESLDADVAVGAGLTCTVCGAGGAELQGYRDPDLGDVALCAAHRDRGMDWA